MIRTITLTLAFAAVALTGSAFGGYVEIELPAGITSEDVLHPTDAVKAELDRLQREEIAKHPEEVENAPVVFTKNGDIIK